VSDHEAYVKKAPPYSDEWNVLREYLDQEFHRIERAFNGVDLKAESRVLSLYRPAISMHAPTSGAPGELTTLSDGAGSTGIQVFAFDPTSVEQLYDSVQLPYGYSENTNLSPSLYWFTDQSATPASQVVWGLEFRVQNRSGTLGATVTQLLTATCGAQRQMLTADFNEYTASAALAMALIPFRVFRAATNGGDTCKLDAHLMGVGFHYEQDEAGGIARHVK
jgi:hypothetical protein